jgi:hypothetical protein
MQVLKTADFETTVSEDDCRVWAWATCDIENPDLYEVGNSLDDFWEYCKCNELILYFHNLKFDGQFIISDLFRKGYTHIEDKKYATDKSFTTLISDKGQWYTITVYHKKSGKHVQKTVFYDSLKIIPFSVDKVAKSFNLPLSKLKIDYEEFREIGHILTPDETAYIKNDVGIMARALKVIFDEDLTKMTQGSNALQDYKNIVGEKHFNKWFPTLSYEVDKDIRQAYRGGYTYLPKYRKNSVFADGIVLDVNSLYPSVLHDKPLPFGEPLRFEGKYENDSLYDLYIQAFSCQFELKENYVPTIQVKQKSYGFVPTEYLESSSGDDVVLCLASPDLELFFKHYNVYNVEYYGGWKFKSTTGLFTAYVDKWTERKIQAKKDKNDGQYVLSKLMLNALYGKFALNPNVQSKIPYYDEEKDLVRYRLGAEEKRKPVYLPIGVFTTAWARYKTISSAQAVYNRFIYADTDSLHLIGKEVPEGLDIDDYRLGAWKHESSFIKAKFLRQKGYMEYTIISESEYLKIKEKIDKGDSKKKIGMQDGIYYEIKITCAGMMEGCKEYVNFDNFSIGSQFPGKLQQKKVRGGVILKKTSFKLKEK